VVKIKTSHFLHHPCPNHQVCCGVERDKRKDILNMTDIFNKKEFVKKRQYLRNNMTKAEIILWSKLKGKQLNGLKFRRQYGINNYVVDFYCPELRLAIEVDGEVHCYDSRITYDKQRQRDIEALGIKVLRYSNNDVIKNLEGVLNDILTTTPHSPPSQGGDKGEVGK
jgi:very-short-patch-repair endonuclease